MNPCLTNLSSQCFWEFVVVWTASILVSFYFGYVLKIYQEDKEKKKRGKKK